jgi:hypothetical protein
MIASRNSLLLLTLLPFYAVILVQPSGYVRSYSINQDFGDIALSLESINDNLIFTTGSVVEVPEDVGETQIVICDSQGDIISSTVWLQGQIRYTGSFQDGMLCFGDTVLATAEVRANGRSGYLTLVSTSLETGESSYNVRLDDMVNYVSSDLHYSPDSSHTIEVSSRDFDIGSYFPITISRLSLTGNRLSKRNYFDEYRKFSSRSSRIDSEGNLYITFNGCIGPNGCDGQQAWITKIDSEGEILWTKNYGKTAGNQIVEPYITLLSEDRMVLAWTRDTNNLDIQESPPIVYILSREGEKLDSIAFHGNQRTLSRIQTAANGDIIGTGSAWTDIGTCGWMIRVTPQAKLVWERYIQDNRLSDDVYTELRDIVECSDGSVAAAGFLIPYGVPRDGGNNLRSWVVKLDANGCLEPNCTSDTIHLMPPVSSEEPQQLPISTMQISPNPVANSLHLEVSDLVLPSGRLIYTISSSNGRILTSGPLGGEVADIDVSDLPAGLYFISLSASSRLVAVRRFVKR